MLNVTASRMKCQLTAELELITADKAVLPLVGQQRNWTHHMIRDLCRRAQWERLRARCAGENSAGSRDDLLRFDGAIDYPATCAKARWHQHSLKAS